MEYRILEKIINCKLDGFVAEYRNASKLFENEDSKNKLLHPGEYGMYKESLLRELLRFILPPKFEIGTGFLYNVNKNVTGQCDIVIFDYVNTPLMNLDSKEHFYPQESVYAIGEVKSILSKQGLKSALISLAEKKKIRTQCNLKINGGPEIKIDIEKNEMRGIFTFLVCDKIDMNMANWADVIKKIYESEGIKPCLRHNMIISLSDGVILYKTIEEMDIDGSGSDKFWPHPTFQEKELNPFRFISTANEIGYEREREILKQFIKHLNNQLIDMDSYYPEPTLYF